MMKHTKMILTFMLALLLALSLAACSSKPAEDSAEAPAGDAVFESDGMKLTVPEQYADLLIVQTETGMQDNASFRVSEKASVEAGGPDSGAGWLFSIAKVDEDIMHELRMGEYPGARIFAKDADGNYICAYYPTDVRIAREGEITEADMTQWSALNEWARSVPETFMAENEGLETFKVSDTALDGYLARMAYLADVSYSLSATSFGEQQPGDVDKTPFVSKLLDGATFESYTNGGAPDGEYIVLNLPDEHVQIHFFPAEPSTIRVVTDDGTEQLYLVRYANKTIKAVDVMQSWYDALVAANQ